MPNKINEIVERDDGFIEGSSYSDRYFEDYPKWSEKEKKAIALARGRVLDIGCGAGRHSLYLQRKGFDVTGIDNSPGAIKVCKLRGLKKTRLLSVEQIGNFKPDSFDTIMMMGNNFGLFGSSRKAKTLLGKLSKITSRHAKIIAENRNPYRTNRKVHLSYHEFNRKRGRLAGQLKLRVIFNKIIGDWFDYLFVSPQEMRKILNGTGWKIKRIISEKSPDYIVVIEKL
ncbi:MAG: class I SAM-dependent methyltransferase [bacterium]|nr:class I SAM-dependent methyltransferase [bacterium]